MYKPHLQTEKSVIYCYCDGCVSMKPDEEPSRHFESFVFKGAAEMSRVCEICGKKPIVGYNVSHAHNKTKTRWYPNLQKVRCVRDGQTKRIRVCTACIKSGRVVKPTQKRAIQQA